MKILSKKKGDQSQNETVETVQTQTAENAKKKDKKKFKFTKKTVGIIAGVLVVVLIASNVVSAKTGGTSVEVAKAVVGDMVSEVEINGNVVSKLSKTYYSDIDGKIGSICFEEGEPVKKGDILITYDADDLEYRATQAELTAQINEDNYKDKIASNGKTVGMYSEANGSLKSLDEQIMFYQTSIVQLDAEIEKKKAALANEGANLQISLMECDPDDYENLQKQVQRNTYEQAHNKDLVQMMTTQQYYKENLSECKTKKAEMESQKKSSYSSMMTESGKESLEMSQQSSELSDALTMENIEKAKSGIVSDFNGVVTKITAKEGGVAGKNTELITVESTDDLVVSFKLGKFDMENVREGQKASVKIRNKNYSGVVSKLDRKVTDDGKGNSGVGMEIRLDEVDDDIIIGVESKATIDTGSVENALMVPKGAIYSSTEGEYVYVVKDDKAVKTDVEVGIYTADDIQILSGLSEGDTVVLAGETEIKDGEKIKAKAVAEEK